MPDLVAFIILGHGTARLTALISRDDITEKLRDLIWYWSPPLDDERQGRYYQSMRRATRAERRDRRAKVKGLPWYDYWFTGQDTLRKPGFWGQAIACPLCISVWIAAADYASYLLWSDIIIHINVFLAISFVGGAATTRYWR